MKRWLRLFDIIISTGFHIFMLGYIFRMVTYINCLCIFFNWKGQLCKLEIFRVQYYTNRYLEDIFIVCVVNPLWYQRNREIKKKTISVILVVCITIIIIIAIIIVIGFHNRNHCKWNIDDLSSFCVWLLTHKNISDGSIIIQS